MAVSSTKAIGRMWANHPLLKLILIKETNTKHNQTVKTMKIFAKKKVAKHGTRLRDRWAAVLAGDASQTPHFPN